MKVAAVWSPGRMNPGAHSEVSLSAAEVKRRVAGTADVAAVVGT